MLGNEKQFLVETPENWRKDYLEKGTVDLGARKVKVTKRLQEEDGGEQPLILGDHQ